MTRRMMITRVVFALSCGAWSNFTQCESPGAQARVARSSTPEQFYATVHFVDGSGNNERSFAQPIAQAPGSNTPADGYIVDPKNNMVNLKFTIDNGQSSSGYKSGNVKIVWDAIPAGYASASAFLKGVKVSGTKGSGQISNGRYVWTSKNAVKPGSQATVTFQFPLYASDGTRIMTVGVPQALHLFSQTWGFTVSTLKQPAKVTNTSLYFSGKVNLERAAVTFRTSGCVQSNPNPVTGPVSFSYLIFPTYANSSQLSNAFETFTWPRPTPQDALCPPVYSIGLINANYTYGAYYECHFCECPNCGVACTIEPPVMCWSASAVYKNQKCRFQTYSNTLPTTVAFSGFSSSGNNTTDTYCCASLP